jgi:hypothetical protein
MLTEFIEDSSTFTDNTEDTFGLSVRKLSSFQNPEIHAFKESEGGYFIIWIIGEKSPYLHSYSTIARNSFEVDLLRKIT